MPDAKEPTPAAPPETDGKAAAHLQAHLGCFGILLFVLSGFVAMALGEDYTFAGVIGTLIGLGLFCFAMRKRLSAGSSDDVSDIGPQA